MNLHLTQHTALITGAASGIGLATAKAFAAEQANIILFDLDASVNEIAQDLQQQFQVKTASFQLDVTKLSDLQQTLENLTVTNLLPQHIVHCAATGSGKFGFPFTNLSPDDWQRSLEVNIMGLVNLAHVFTPHLRTARYGSFISLASVAGQIGSQTDPPYSASKAANINFAQCMAKDLAPYGIRVNTICPGMVKSPLNRSVWQAWWNQATPSDRLSYEEWTAKKIQAVVPLGRWQEPEDIADMIVFLSSDRAKQVTGQTINVDGGFVMHW